MMKVEVRFCAHIREVNQFPCINEDELRVNFEKYRESLLNNFDSDGFIIISSLGQPDVRIQDELSPLVQNLCFIAILDLIAHKHVVVKIYNNYGYVRLDPEADWVRISGDGLPDVRVERSELIISLYDCGKRFIEFIRMLRGNEPDYQDMIQGLEEYAEAAKQSVEDPSSYKKF